MITSYRIINITRLLFLVIAAITLGTSSVEADTIYQPAEYPDYNGSDDGYIMSWDGTAQDSYLRVAFSTSRSGYQLGKQVSTYIRAEAYYSRDSGWWYTYPEGQVDFVRIYYPNGTQIVDFAGTTDSKGVLKNKTTLKLSKTLPLGTYKLTASVTKGSTTVGEGENGYLTIFIDVGGNLNLTASASDVEKDQNVTITGQVIQPNGELFNSSIVGTDGAVDVHAGIISPNESYTEVTNSTTNGNYIITFNATQIGHYFIVITANSTIAGEEDCEGRTQLNVLATGEWPPAEASFAGPVSRVIIAVILALILFSSIRRRLKL